VLILEQAGFADIQIFGDYRTEPATAYHRSLVYIAKSKGDAWVNSTAAPGSSNSG
jgi:hypothetical protein